MRIVFKRLFCQMENEEIRSPFEMECLLFNDERTRKLAMKAYIAFLRNALKKVFQRSIQQNSSISTLNSQVKNTKMQICTLKSLLCSDEQFRRDCIVEHYKLKKKIEAVINERDELRIENHHLETNMDEVKEELNSKTVELLNEKNSLQQMRSEATALELQLEKEREKIKALKNELKRANEKEQKFVKALHSRTKDVDSLSLDVRNLEMQICSQMELLKLSEEKLANDNQKLKEEEKKVKMMKTELELSKVTVASLYKDKNYLQKEIDEKNSKYESMEKAYKEQTIHLIELKTSVMALEAQTLSSKFVSLATMLMKVPLAFLSVMSSESR
ncbi:uncharacterized protein isoform X2 [Rhodnius prolixus]|uniref:uncharacterized protein isoform X2 n=1 Tax=Rhodnius prolixus TaxID=13249 RepID=UPI003D189525